MGERGCRGDDALSCEREFAAADPGVAGQHQAAGVVELGGEADGLALLAAEVELAGGGLGEVGDGASAGREAGVACGQDAQQRLLDLPRGGHAAGVLLGVHPLVGDAQRLGRVGGLARQRDRAIGAADPEAVAVL